MAQPSQLIDRRSIATLLEDPSRAGAAQAAAELVRPGMTVGLGSGRAVWAAMELLSHREELTGLQVVSASAATERLARSMGFETVRLDGRLRLELAIDGADEVAANLDLIKGNGAALLREKLVAVAARRFVIVAEANKRVERLGERGPLSVEVVRFAWADTARRLRERFDEVALRVDDDGPLITDEGNHLLDLRLPADAGDPAQVATALSCTVGVVEHGLFLDMADEALLGGPDGAVEVLRRDG